MVGLGIFQYQQLSAKCLAFKSLGVDQFFFLKAIFEREKTIVFFFSFFSSICLVLKLIFWI